MRECIIRGLLSHRCGIDKTGGDDGASLFALLGVHGASDSFRGGFGSLGTCDADAGSIRRSCGETGTGSPRLCGVGVGPVDWTSRFVSATLQGVEGHRKL